jgi:hypothetical protein
MRSVKSLFSLTLTTLSLLFLASGCGKDAESSAATTSKIKIMAEDKTAVLIESFELKAGETQDAFITRIKAKLPKDEAVKDNAKIPKPIQTLLAAKTPSVTGLSNQIKSLLDSSDKKISDPSKLKDKDTISIVFTDYLDYENHLTEADLPGANLTGANLTGANLTNADLTEADLTEADLTEADLTKANLTRVNLTDTDLTDTDLRNATLTEADFTDAICTKTRVTSLSVFDNVKSGTISKDEKNNTVVGP